MGMIVKIVEAIAGLTLLGVFLFLHATGRIKQN